MLEGQMLVAVFTVASGMPGKVIKYDEGRFVTGLDDEITAARIVALDDAGYLDWSHGAIRDWVRSRAAGPAGQAEGSADPPPP